MLSPIIVLDNIAAFQIHLLNQLANYQSVFVLSDENTYSACWPLIDACIPTAVTHIVIPAGETQKTIETCSRVWEELGEKGGDRKSLLVNIGGGVVTDLGGFVASTFKRGIDFVNIPTTLLSMVDASVGGKTGVDFNHLKNEIGTFAMPRAVLICPAFLKTLAPREWLSGYAEMLKHGLIQDAGYWEVLKNKPDEHAMLGHIQRSIQIKSDVVAQDPLENGLRKILNFGHTIGHAIESSLLGTQDELKHGEAIAAGMIIESYLSYKKCGLAWASYLEIAGYLSSIYPKATIDNKQVINLIRKDKKNVNSEWRLALISNIGSGVYDIVCQESDIEEALAIYAQL